jgi:hypothetical protein
LNSSFLDMLNSTCQAGRVQCDFAAVSFFRPEFEGRAAWVCGGPGRE